MAILCVTLKLKVKWHISMALGCLSLTTLCPVNLGLLVKHRMAKSEGFLLALSLKPGGWKIQGLFFWSKISQNWVIKGLIK